MDVSSFATALCSAVIAVLPYVVVYRIVDIVFCTVSRAVFEGKLSFRGSKV